MDTLRKIPPRNYAKQIFAILFFTIAALLVGSLLYYLVEAPFMRLRDRWVHSNFYFMATLNPPRMLNPGPGSK